MLYEEQAAELLRRCEAIAGRELRQVRGNLRKAATRAEAVWELLVLEAASRIGEVQCEPPGGGPDIRLRLPSGRWVSIEVTYLHPRFEDQERRRDAVTRWIGDVGIAIEPQRVALECSFTGGQRHEGGTRLRLPQEHERSAFLASPEVSSFLAAVRSRPMERHHVALSQYDITMTSRPRTSEQDRFSHSSYPAFESPLSVSEHAAYRSLKAKIDQHKVDEPYIVCIGSDVSVALRTAFQGYEPVRLQNALSAALRPSGRLSAVLVASIESSYGVLSRYQRGAKCTLYTVENSRHPLSPDESAIVQGLNLNRWRYTFPLARRETAPEHRHPKVTGSLSIGYMKNERVKLTVPTSVLVDVLAGRKSLLDEYRSGDGWLEERVTRCLREGWTIAGCSIKAGDIEQAQSAMIELELVPPHDPVYWADPKRVV